MKAKFQGNFPCRYLGMYTVRNSFLHCLAAHFIKLSIRILSLHFVYRIIACFKKNSLPYNGKNLLPLTFAETGTRTHVFRIKIVPGTPTISNLVVHNLLFGSIALKKPFFQLFFIKSHILEVQ